MKKIFLLIAMFISIFAIQAQNETDINRNEKNYEIKDNLFKVGIYNNISISNNLILQNGLSVRKNLDFVTLEVPLLIEHNISNKWSTFLGVQSRKVIYINFPELNIEEPSKYYISTGTEYEFKNNATGNLTIGFPFDMKLGLKF